MASRIDGRRVSALIGLGTLTLVLWDTPFVAPLRILVVLFHELAHALAAIATGGEVVRIELERGEGGACLARGGSRFLVLNAGYLGSLAIGGVVMVAASRTRHDRALSAGLGLFLVAASMLWVRPLLGFGLPFGVAAGVALLALARFGTHALNETVLQLIGLTSSAYALLDIWSDVMARPELVSDARMLSQEVGLPVWFWGSLWLVASLAASATFLVLACRAPVRTPALAPPPASRYPARTARPGPPSEGGP